MAQSCVGTSYKCMIGLGSRESGGQSKCHGLFVAVRGLVGRTRGCCSIHKSGRSQQDKQWTVLISIISVFNVLLVAVRSSFLNTN